MSTKVLLVLAFAMLAVQVSAGVAVQPRDMGDIVKPIAQLLEKLTVLVAKVCDKLSDLVGKYLTNYTEMHEWVIDMAVKTMVAANDLALGVFDNMSDKADENGKKLIECFNNEKTNVESFLNSTITEGIDCFTTESPQILAYVQKFFNFSSTTVTQVTASLQEMETCTAGTEVCLLQFANECLTTAKSYINTIKTEGAEFLEIIKKMPATLLPCLQTSIKTWESGTVQRINNIGKCMS